MQNFIRGAFPYLPNQMHVQGQKKLKAENFKMFKFGNSKKNLKETLKYSNDLFNLKNLAFKSI